MNTSSKIDTSVDKVNKAYSGFFSNTLPNICCAPAKAVYDCTKTNADFGLATGFMGMAICCCPLSIPTVVTMLVGMALSVPAAISYPFAVGGAEIQDRCCPSLQEQEVVETDPLTYTTQ